MFAYPFSQICDDVSDQIRLNSDQGSSRAVIKNAVNRVYRFKMMSRFEYDWLRKTARITLTAPYQEGTVTITAGTTALTGSGTTWTAAMTGRKVIITGNENEYEFTFVSATSATISPALSGSTNISGASYRIIQNVYDLPEDYDRPVLGDDPMYYELSSGTFKVDFRDDLYFRKYYTNQLSEYANDWREVPGITSNGLKQFQISPAPSSARIIVLEYIRAFPEMTEFSTGTATTEVGSTAVALSDDYSDFISVNDYFRINSGDKTWRRITAVNGVNLTLDSGYPTTNTAASYTTSSAPDMPFSIQSALFDGACWELSKGENDPSQSPYFADYDASVNRALSIKSRKRYGSKYFKSGKHYR